MNKRRDPNDLKRRKPLRRWLRGPYPNRARPASSAFSAQLEKERAIGINPKFYATRSWRKQTDWQARWENAEGLWIVGKRDEARALLRRFFAPLAA